METPLSISPRDTDLTTITALTATEIRKRKDQRKKRPRVYEKIKAFHRDMSSGVISPILRLKINRSLCNFKCTHCCEEPYMSRDLKKKTGAIVAAIKANDQAGLKKAVNCKACHNVHKEKK